MLTHGKHDPLPQDLRLYARNSPVRIPRRAGHDPGLICNNFITPVDMPRHQLRQNQ